jgi:hypothetical protein
MFPYFKNPMLHHVHFVGNSGAGDVVLQQGGIFVFQLYTVVKEGLVSLSDSLLGMESG